jgi:hypothetical protein
MAVAGLIAYQAGQPRTLVTEAEGSQSLWEGMATNQSAELTAFAGVLPRYPTLTPTKTPRPATATREPTFAGQDAQGYYVVPKWTEVPPPAATSVLELPPCATVTPVKFADIACEVKA